MKNWLEIFNEGGIPSLTRALIALGYVTFLIVSCILAFTGHTWGNYSEFALATGGAVLAQLGNKYINSRYNTPQGCLGKEVKHNVQE